MTFVMGGVLTLAPGSDRIPVELFQILTQYAICRLPALINIWFNSLYKLHFKYQKSCFSFGFSCFLISLTTRTAITQGQQFLCWKVLVWWIFVCDSFPHLFVPMLILNLFTFRSISYLQTRRLRRKRAEACCLHFSVPSSTASSWVQLTGDTRWN